MPVVFITGAASGLGLAFLNHYASLQQPAWTIIAVGRNPLPPTVATTTTTNTSNVTFYQLDLASEPSIATLAHSIQTNPTTTTTTTAAATPPSSLPPSPPLVAIDLLIHSAGIRGLVPDIHAAHPDDVARAETLSSMTAATMLQAFSVNTVATFLLVRALLPNLLAASAQAQAQAQAQASPKPKPKVIVMGSRMGSIAKNVAGGSYAYRSSKAALNAVVKSFSLDVPQVLFTIVHPGRVETGLVRMREEGAIEAGESVKDMVALIERLDGNERALESGCHVDRFGEAIPW